MKAALSRRFGVPFQGSRRSGVVLRVLMVHSINGATIVRDVVSAGVVRIAENRFTAGAYIAAWTTASGDRMIQRFTLP